MEGGREGGRIEKERQSLSQWVFGAGGHRVAKSATRFELAITEET